MSGTIPLSLSQQFDRLGNPLAGGKLYIIQAGTVSTPQVAYQDAALTIPYPGGSVLTLDAAGRIGQFFLADGLIKIRLTDKNGIEQIVADGVQVIGPSSGGGGGGGSVDPTTILTTGDIKIRYGTGVLAGFVRQNGRTIGSATSGATERANADTQFLFEYLWNTDPNLAVSTGRGASANADWVANKTIALPDQRGRVIAGLDDMGNTAAGRLTATYFGVSATVLGAGAGLENFQLLPTHLPNSSYVLQGSPATINVTSTINYVALLPSGWLNSSSGGGAQQFQVAAPGTGFTGGINSTGSYTPAGQIGPLGSNTPHRTVQPTILMTIYQKL